MGMGGSNAAFIASAEMGVIIQVHDSLEETRRHQLEASNTIEILNGLKTSLDNNTIILRRNYHERALVLSKSPLPSRI